MAIEFNANEAFELAEQIERNGAVFYEEASRSIDDQDKKELLAKLAEWERGHEKIFAEMRTEFSNKEKEATAFDPDNEIVLYLRAMADTHVFSTGKTSGVLKGGESAEDILRIALGFEKDSIAYFLGMKELVPESLGKDRIDRIVNEEIRHVAVITRSIKTLQG